jgi:hypothetical protein
MTAQQLFIADTALSRHRAQNFGVIREEVSQLTGIGISEVKQTLDYLSREFIIKLCTNPARNVFETPITEDDLTWAWYEPGECWP